MTKQLNWGDWETAPSSSTISHFPHRGLRTQIFEYSGVRYDERGMGGWEKKKQNKVTGEIHSQQEIRS